MPPPDPIHWYDRHAAEAVGRFEALQLAELLGWVADLLPADAALVLDVGSGSARDSAWLAERGADVGAVEPSAAMQTKALRHHPNS